MSSTILFDVADAIPDAIIDIRYATSNNFTKRQLYKTPHPQLRKQVLSALVFAAAVLRAQGYKLVIYDAYRSPHVQKMLQEVCEDTNYVAAVSNHCRGITVDVSLADVMNTYVEMGTEYDDFTEKAHANTSLIPDWQQKNRLTLANAMTRHGFVQHPNEWWHFDYVQGLNEQIIDSADNVI